MEHPIFQADGTMYDWLFFNRLNEVSEIYLMKFSEGYFNF